MAAAEHSSLADLLGDVISASKLRPKQRAISIKPTVDKLVSAAYENGLLPETLSNAVELLTTPGYLDQASLGAIARNLYPAAAVSGDIILQVIGALGHGQLKPALSIQAILLRWIVMVYHLVDTPGVLSQAYAVLFNLLDTAAIRSPLCHLLALVTKRQHVRPFRIQALLSLSRQVGSDPSMIGLLRVYKDYYPEIIVGDAVRGRAAAFKHPDPQWRSRLDELQHIYLRNREVSIGSENRNGFQSRRQGFAGSKRSIIPSLHTSHATEHSVTLEEINSAANLARHLENIDLPDQLVAVIADPLLQKLLQLRPAQESHQRINNWITAAIHDFTNQEAGPEAIADALEVLHDYVTQTKHVPPVLVDFFVGLLAHWNGVDGKEHLFAALSFIPLRNFEELRTSLFHPLENCVAGEGPEALLVLLKFYQSLLRNWSAALLSLDAPPPEQCASLAMLVQHAERLALTLSQTSPTTPTMLAILNFYEENASILSNEQLAQYVRIAMPSASLIYSFIFSQSLAVISRICSVLACYKKGFETAMTTKSTDKPGAPPINAMTYDRAYVNTFNGFLMDICNCLWRSRAFTRADPNSVGCLVPQHIVPQLGAYVSGLDTGISLPSLFGLSHSPTLCLQAILCLRDLEDAQTANGESSLYIRHAGPVSQDSLARLSEAGGLQLSWQDYRISVLQALEAAGLPGIPELMKNTMKILMAPKKGTTTTS